MNKVGAVKRMNGEYQAHCRYEGNQLDILNSHFEKLNRISEARDEWVRMYIEKTMPVKSHYWILLGSLTILSSFAAVIKYIEKF